MPDAPLYVSQLWPPARPRAVTPTLTTMNLLENLGFVGRTAATGVHTLLPLGLRVHDRLSRIARDAFEDRGANTVAFPTLQSRTLWEESGRWDVYQAEGALLTTRSRSGEDLCLAPTSEEIAVATVRGQLRSRRDLPVRLYLSTAKFRDERSPRGGLMRGREFVMGDAYTFDTDAAGMHASTSFLNDACRAALVGMGLTGVFQATADGGSIASGPSTEHLVLGDIGQSSILACDRCGHRGDAAVISGRPVACGNPVINVIGFVLTRPDGSTAPAAVAIRSDLHVSPRKLAAATGASRVDLLDTEALPGLFGKQAGTLTPWDCSDTELYFDTSVALLDDFSISDGSDGLRPHLSWAGAPGLPPLTPDGTVLHRATDGMGCGRCDEGRYHAIRAIEVAHVFELGTQYSAPMGLTVPDAQGNAQPAHMACSGIGITRCLQTLADLHRDHHGLRWKPGCGPADLHLIVLRADLPEMLERTDRIVRQLQHNGTRLLVDDRPEAAGEKFAYARRVGVPHALVLSPQQTDDTVEYIDRWTSRHEAMPLSHIPVPANTR